MHAQEADTPTTAWPRSIAACLPELWNRVLFPGRCAEPGGIRWRSLFLLVIVAAALLYPSLAFPLLEPDESRYAEIPREMLARGDWIVPYLQGEPYLDKPPLLYWLVMLSYQVFGVADWAARLVPALAIHATVLLAYLFGKRSFGERAAFWGALLLALAPGFTSMGRLLVLDGLLAFCVTLSIFAAFEALRGHRFRWSWWLLSAAACGGGILTKGPIALLLLAPPLWLFGVLGDRSRRVGWGAWLVLGTIVVALALPWYVNVCLRVPEFAKHFLWEHNVVRFLTPFDHQQPVWFYGPVLLLGLLPGSLLLPPFLRFLSSGQHDVSDRRGPELGFAMLAGGWCLIFFTLSGSKLPTYILPAFPFLCLALGYFIACSRWDVSRWTRGIAVTSFVLMCVGHHLLVPWYAKYRSPMGRPEEVARLCADPNTPVICYPRECNSVAFYLGRADFKSFRSKQVDPMRAALLAEPRTVVLFTHRHSLRAFQQFLPPNTRLTYEAHFGLGDIPGAPSWLADKIGWFAGETAHGLCDMAVIDRPN
jgi:4-amino-4-deoxy-L-arabinose transferase-like glycosyltransferase